MQKLINTFRDKRFRYGSLSTVMILLAVSLFIMVNLIVGQLNISLDMTKDKMYSLSSNTKEFLGTLTEDITIYALFVTGQENLMFKQLLEEYAATSNRIRVEYRDPVLYPSFVESYAQAGEKIENNSVIVVSASRFKVVPYSDMVTMEFDYNIWDYTLKSIDIEPRISNAINFVTQANTPTIYFVTGSGESSLSANLIKQITMANYEFKEINLVREPIPEDCNVLFITSPTRDWTAEEALQIRTYLENNGRAIFALGYSSTPFPNLAAVLSGYGVALGEYLVVEGNTQYYYQQTPMALIPDYGTSEITEPLLDSDFFPLLYLSTGIDLLSLKKPTTEITPLLITSRQAYGKVGTDFATQNKEPGDVDGPFNLAVAIHDTYFTDQQYVTKIVVTSCYFILEEAYNAGVNWDFIVNSINWLQDESTSVYIPSKSPASSTQLSLNQSQANMLAAISCAVMPLAVIITGLVVWLRRRNS